MTEEPKPQTRFKGIDGEEYTSFKELEEAHKAYCKHQTIDDKFLIEPTLVKDEFFTEPVSVHDKMPTSYPIYDAIKGLVHILLETNKEICIGFKIESDGREVPVYRIYSNPTWSHDSKKIVYHSDRNGDNEILEGETQ